MWTLRKQIWPHGGRRRKSLKQKWIRTATSIDVGDFLNGGGQARTVVIMDKGPVRAAQDIEQEKLALGWTPDFAPQTVRTVHYPREPFEKVPHIESHCRFYPALRQGVALSLSMWTIAFSNCPHREKPGISMVANIIDQRTFVTFSSSFHVDSTKIRFRCRRLVQKLKDPKDIRSILILFSCRFHKGGTAQKLECRPSQYSQHPK